MLGLLFYSISTPKLIWDETIPGGGENNNKEGSQPGLTVICRCHKQRSWRSMPKQSVTTENKIVNKSFGTFAWHTGNLDSIWFFTYLPTNSSQSLSLLLGNQAVSYDGISTERAEEDEWACNNILLFADWTSKRIIIKITHRNSCFCLLRSAVKVFLTWSSFSPPLYWWN